MSLRDRIEAARLAPADAVPERDGVTAVSPAEARTLPAAPEVPVSAVEAAPHSTPAGKPAAPSAPPAASTLREPTPVAEDPFAELKERAAQELFIRIGARLNDSSLTEERLHALAREELIRIVGDEQVALSPAERTRVIDEIGADVLGYGPLEPLLTDDTVTEIMVNGYEQIFVEREGQLIPYPARFSGEAQLRRVIERIVGRVGRRVDESSPLVDARLEDGSRVNAIIPPLAVNGASLTIRKFSRRPYTVDDLIGFGTLTPEIALVLEAAVRGRLNMLVSGGTGTGKTTLLNVLSAFIPENERIVTIEDAVELQLQQTHVVRLESRPPNIEGRGEVTIRDLVRNSLRMRPDRIVIGEVRGGESLDLLQAMNTGHEGSISTVHANSPRDAIARLETLVLMAGMDLPLRAIREQIASAVDIIVQVTRLRDGTRRVTHVTEVNGMEGEVITLQDVFTFDFAAGLDESGRFRGSAAATGIRPKFAERLHDLGIELPVLAPRPTTARSGR